MTDPIAALWDGALTLTRWLDRSNGESREEGTYRILKLAEEYGEVVEASTLHLAGEPERLISEVCDVIITAAVAALTIARDLEACRRTHSGVLAARDPGGDLQEWEAIETLSRRSGVTTAKLLSELGIAIGWAAQVRIGQVGRNPRKGVTHNPADVTATLCNIIVTGQTLLVSVLGDGAAARDTLAAKTAAILTRITTQTGDDRG